jgi:pilus assembly protein CpaC
VSEVDPAAITPTQPEQPRRAEKKRRKDDRAASNAQAATPGFSL